MYFRERLRAHKPLDSGILHCLSGHLLALFIIIPPCDANVLITLFQVNHGDEIKHGHPGFYAGLNAIFQSLS